MVKEKHLTSFQAIDLISLIVDAQGNPQNVCVQKPAGYGLDGEAVKAVKKYRFKPATKEDGTSVSVRITVKVDFRLY
jgi:TonB family protein